MTAYAGIAGDVWFSTSPPTALGSPETANDSGDHIHYFMATHIAWDQTKTLTVQCSPNGSSSWVTVTDYVFLWPVGEIVFNTARVVSTNNFVRVFAGSWFTLTQLPGAHMWKMQAKANTKDITTFGATGNYALNLTTTKAATFSVQMYASDAKILTEMGATNTSGGIIVCSFYWDVTNSRRWQFYALTTGEDTNVVSQDVNKQTVNLVNTGPIYRITSSSFSTATVKML